MWFGTLRVINDDTIAAGKWFWEHPHQDMEIITIPFSGSLSHKDSMWNSSIIQAGEVQSMSAGSGILHSEMNHNPYESVSLFQIWILTRELGIKPQYSQKEFLESERLNTWQLLAGPDKNGSNVLINQDACISRVTLEEGKNLDYTCHFSWNGVYIMNISWEFKIDEHILNSRDALWITGSDAITCIANEKSDILVIEAPMK